MDKMEKNVVVEKLEKIAGTDKVEFFSGTIFNVATGKCKLENKTGSVYGIAVKFPNILIKNKFLMVSIMEELQK